MSPPIENARASRLNLDPSGHPKSSRDGHQALNRPLVDTGLESHAEVIAALRDGPLVRFDMGSTAIVGPGGVEGRVWIRADGRTWSISCLDASLLALLVRIEAFRAADLLADALVQASIEAEHKVDAIHRWSGRVRPTEDGE